MTGLQSSFNSNLRWVNASLPESSVHLATSYILKADKYPWIGAAASSHAPANQFGRQPENERDLDDYLTPFFLVFFFVYALCRVML